MFGNILERFNKKKQQADESQDTSYTPAAEEFCDDLCNKLDDMQHQNADDPNLVTADGTVFTDMKAQIEALKKQVAEQEKAPTINNIPTPDLASLGSSMAVTNSNNGSLVLEQSQTWAHLCVK